MANWLPLCRKTPARCTRRRCVSLLENSLRNQPHCPGSSGYTRRRDQTLAVRPCRRLLGALPQYVSESIRHRFSIFGAFAALVNRLPAIMLAIPWKPGLEFGFDAIPISSAYYRPLRSC